jgi:pantetheine-phosphate adenylyltransferase
VLIAVLVNADKKPLFSAGERVDIISEVFREYPNVEVDSFEGLLVDYARARRASAIVRGLRAVSDFEYEFQMALMNRHLEPTLETVFMMPAEQYTYLSSRLIKEVFSLGGEVRGLVPPTVEDWMRKKQSKS